MIPGFTPATVTRPRSSTTNAQLATIAQERLEHGEGAVDQVVDISKSASDR
jgi:hypothetical protein